MNLQNTVKNLNKDINLYTIFAIEYRRGLLPLFLGWFSDVNRCSLPSLRMFGLPLAILLFNYFLYLCYVVKTLGGVRRRYFCLLQLSTSYPRSIRRTLFCQGFGELFIYPRLSISNIYHFPLSFYQMQP